ncbi:MAG: C13 family peptidase [Candidatus Hermodarchaeota archaeon]
MGRKFVFSLAIICIGVLASFTVWNVFIAPDPIEPVYNPWWALIVAGSNENRFTHDAFCIYNTLIDHYNFTDHQTYLLTHHPSTWEGELPYPEQYGDPPIPWVYIPRDAVTSLTSIEWAVSQIADQVKPDDQVIIWWTGHGTNESGGLVDTGHPDDYISPTQLDNILDVIKCRQMIIFLGSCFSGAFINELKEANRIIYTASRENETSHASVVAYSVWNRAIYHALDPDFSAYTADTDSNGRISLWEVYDYANTVILNKFDDQHPQRWVGLNFSMNNRSDAHEYIANGYYLT